MDDQNQNQNNTNQADAGDIKNEAASASPSLDNPKLDLAEEYLNNWKRERADFVNYKKDEAKRVEEFIKFANEGLILELLDVIEESMVARTQMPKEIQEKYPEWIGGVDKIREKGFEFLKGQGVERIKTIGEKFDPLLHESVEEIAPASAEGSGKVISDGGESGKVIEEVKPGFTLHGRVIKPARVRITK